MLDNETALPICGLIAADGITALLVDLGGSSHGPAGVVTPVLVE